MVPNDQTVAGTSPTLELETCMAGQMSDNVTVYPHRRNEEGSYDSICRECFATVVRGKEESELSAYEEAHICDPIHMLSDLARRC